jgi:hypothetical protein
VLLVISFEKRFTTWRNSYAKVQNIFMKILSLLDQSTEGWKSKKVHMHGSTQGCPSPSGELAQTIRQKDCNQK